MKIEQLHKLFIKSKGITSDTRKIEGGEIFFALKGPNFNANKFALKAIELGCDYAVVDELDKDSSDKRLVKVNDVLTTLQALANFHRKQFDIPVLGITGTNGKTTNKELINTVLSKKYNVSCTKGNLNNHIGVPLTLLSLTDKHEIAIVEMGANHIGEIEELCKITEPTHGLITSIGIAHLEGFGSLEGVKKTKRELFDYIIEHDGKCFVNLKANLVKELFDGNSQQAISYGTVETFLYSEIVSSASTLKVDINLSGKNYKLDSNLIGAFQNENLLNAFAIGHYFEVNPKDIIEALASYNPKNNRSQQIEWMNNQVILDAYNANPTSMEAAIYSFVDTELSNKVVLLGDMLELGKYSLRYHQEIVDLLNDKELSAVVLVGQEFLKTDYPNTFHVFEETESAKAWFLDQAFENKSILVKGSRGIGLEKVFN